MRERTKESSTGAGVTSSSTWRNLIWLALVTAVVASLSVGDLPQGLLLFWNFAACLLGIHLSTRTALRPVSTAFFTFWLSWLGIAPLVQLIRREAAWGDRLAFITPADVDNALLMNAIAATAVLVGGLYSQRKSNRVVSFELARSGDGTPRPIRAGLVLALVLTLCITGPNAVRSLGGLGTYFSSRNERAETLLANGASLEDLGGLQFALITAFPIALSVSISILSLYAIRCRLDNRRSVHKLWFVALLLGVGGLVIFANPLSQTRFIAVTGFGSLLLALLQPRSRRAALIFSAVAFLSTVVVYPLANLFRHGIADNEQVFDWSTFSSADFDGFQQVINTVRLVGDVGHSGGIYVLSALGYFIPRNVWEAKAYPSSLEVAEHAGYRFINLSEPIHAEFYLEFGWAGMILCMLGLGYAIGRIDSAWLSEEPSVLHLIAPYATVAVLGLIRGPLGSQAPIYFTVLLFLVLGYRTGRPRDRLTVANKGSGPATEQSRS